MLRLEEMIFNNKTCGRWISKSWCGLIIFNFVVQYTTEPGNWEGKEGTVGIKQTYLRPFRKEILNID